MREPVRSCSRIPDRRRTRWSYYQRPAALGPNPLALFDIGLVLFQMGRFGEADVALRAALALSPPELLADKARRLLDRVHDEAKAQAKD